MITVQQVSLRNSQHFQSLLKDFWNDYQSGTFFMSRAWLEAWLQSLPSPPLLITFCKNNVLVGFVLLQSRPVHRALPFFKTQCCNQAGVQKYDQAWIEFNRIYCQPEYHESCVDALLSGFPDMPSTVQLYISMADDKHDWLKAATSRAQPTLVEEVTGYKRSLRATTTVDSIIQSLSKNSRSQIRRSLKKAESVWGPITVVSSAGSEKAKDFMALGKLHKTRWQHTAEGSGFSNDAFLNHHHFIIKHFPHLVDVVTVKAGTHLLGMCYNFLWEKRVEFYCCGINDTVPDKHIKPGYLVHLYCMAYYAERGYTEYDFLGGDAQYKKTLADTLYHFYNITVWANSFTAKMVRQIAKLKSLVGRAT